MSEDYEWEGPADQPATAPDFRYKSGKELAAAIGRSPQVITRAIQSGKIPPKPKGGWDPSVIDLLLDSTRERIERQEEDSDLYSISRARKERALADQAEMSAAKMRGDLLPKAQAWQHFYAVAREIRSAWMNWPRRVGAELAGRLNVPADELTRELEIEVRRHLATLSSTIPDGDDQKAA